MVKFDCYKTYIWTSDCGGTYIYRLHITTWDKIHGLTSLDRTMVSLQLFLLILPWNQPKKSFDNMVDPDSEEYFFRIIIKLICALSLFENITLLIWKILRRRKERGYSLIIANLATANCFVALHLMVTILGDVFPDPVKPIHQRVFCRIGGFFNCFGFQASIGILLVQTVDRLISSRNPFKIMGMGWLKLVISLLLVWVVSFCMASAPLLPVSYFRSDLYNMDQRCFAVVGMTTHSSGWEYVFSVHIILNSVVFIVIFGITMNLIIRTCGKESSIETRGHLPEAAFLKKTVALFCVHLLCWSPCLALGMLAF